MNIVLEPELEKLVQDKVASGRYQSASEVICEALRLLEDQDLLRQIKLERLQEEIQKGLDSGEDTSLDMEEIIRECQTEADKAMLE